MAESLEFHIRTGDAYQGGFRFKLLGGQRSLDSIRDQMREGTGVIGDFCHLRGTYVLVPVSNIAYIEVKGINYSE